MRDDAVDCNEAAAMDDVDRRDSQAPASFILHHHFLISARGRSRRSRACASDDIMFGIHSPSGSIEQLTERTPGIPPTPSSTAAMMLLACKQIGLVTRSTIRTFPSSAATSLTIPISTRLIGAPVAIEHGSTTRASAAQISGSLHMSRLAQTRKGRGRTTRTAPSEVVIASIR